MAKKRTKAKDHPPQSKPRSRKKASPRVPATKGMRLPGIPLKRDEAMALLDACPGTWTGVRDRALLTLLWRSGLRISEALALTPTEVDQDRRLITVLRGKGSKYGVAAMDRAAFTALRPWERIRTDLLKAKSTHPLFCTRTLSRMDPSHLRHLLPKLAKKAGITRRVHPHCFRHTLAAEMAAANVQMPIIQAQLRHSNLNTTNTYLAHIAPEQLTRALEDLDDWNRDAAVTNTEGQTPSEPKQPKKPKKRRKKAPPRTG
jgi:site-specific recombinase XerD